DQQRGRCSQSQTTTAWSSRRGRDCGLEDSCRVAPCVAVNTCFSLSGRSWAKSSAIPFAVTVRKPLVSARTSLNSGGGGKGFATEDTDSPSGGANAATYTNPTTFGSFPASVITAPP